MGVTLNKRHLQATLEHAIRLADAGTDLPDEWSERTEHIGESPSKTYVAVLASALLARAAYGERIDPRSIKRRSGPRGFSTRGSIDVLARNARGFGYDLGVSGPEPLNAQPWFHADRVDTIRPEQVRQNAREYLRTLKRYLREVDALSDADALAALAALIVVRRQVADEKRANAIRELRRQPMPLARLAQVIESFVTADAEGGRRGQALVAAALDGVFPRVELGGINDPDAFDVIAYRNADDEVPSPVAQVKQKPVDEEAAILLAEQAAAEGVDAALLVAISPAQESLDDQAIAARVDELGVTVWTATSVASFFGALAMFSASQPTKFAEELEEHLRERLREIEVDEDTLEELDEALADIEESAGLERESDVSTDD